MGEIDGPEKEDAARWITWSWGKLLGVKKRDPICHKEIFKRCHCRSYSIYPVRGFLWRTGVYVGRPPRPSRCAARASNVRAHNYAQRRGATHSLQPLPTAGFGVNRLTIQTSGPSAGG